MFSCPITFLKNIQFRLTLLIYVPQAFSSRRDSHGRNYEKIINMVDCLRIKVIKKRLSRKIRVKKKIVKYLNL